MAACSTREFPSDGSGMQEHEVFKFGHPRRWLCATDDPLPISLADFLMEWVERDVEALAQMAAVAFASLQRVAHEPADILTEGFAAIVETPTNFTCTPHGVRRFATVTGLMFGSLSDIAGILADSAAELQEIAGEHVKDRSADLNRLFGSD
jgi:hypothetical protein